MSRASQPFEPAPYRCKRPSSRGLRQSAFEQHTKICTNVQVLDLVHSLDRSVPCGHMRGEVHQLPPVRTQCVCRRSALICQNTQKLVYEWSHRFRRALLFRKLVLSADHADSPPSGTDALDLFESRSRSFPPRISCNPRTFAVLEASTPSSGTRVFARG